MTTIGYTTGVFDLFHIGHINIIRNAAAACDRLIVGVTTDEAALREKGHPPVIPFSERSEIVGSIRGVDSVVAEASTDKLEAWAALRFHRIFKGSDWRGTARWSRLEDEFRRRDVEVVYFPYTQHVSSSRLHHVLEALNRDGDRP